ncbi:MAG: phosphotransferase family protein, partial [Gammaproteobacteria bacterium]|nr:phosphotransferase family protein [Gammaproteobacteria bacterium]
MTDFKAEDNTGTVPVQDRHQVDLEALTAFMVTSVAGFQGPMQIEEFAGGQSNPTYLLTTP